MKVSIAIIAHNEEKYIAKCLGSLTNQTQKPDEIILVAHNCTDQTVELAKKFSEVRMVELQSPDGIPYARQKSIDEATGDIVLCADGDSSYNPNWVSEMTKAITKPGTVGVGGLVWMSGFVGHWMSFDYFYLTPLTRF